MGATSFSQSLMSEQPFVKSVGGLPLKYPRSGEGELKICSFLIGLDVAEDLSPLMRAQMEAMNANNEAELASLCKSWHGDLSLVRL